MAKNKEWKLKRMNQLGVDTLQRRAEVRSINPIQGHVLKDFQHAAVVSMAPPVMLAIVAAKVPNDGLRKEMREVVDLMKNSSLNLLSNGGANRGQKKSFTRAIGDHP